MCTMINDTNESPDRCENVKTNQITQFVGERRQSMTSKNSQHKVTSLVELDNVTR